VRSLDMNTTLVVNRKGGAGKTTVTINLASFFATQNVSTTIMDYDPQGSSLHWLKSRSPQLGKLHGSNAAPEKFGHLRSFRMYVPSDTRQLIIDAPGGVSGMLLQELLCRANCVVIPVTPSSIDIHATAHFIKDVLLTGLVRSRGLRIAVVANRVRRSIPVYQPLERFLAALNLTLIARLLDSDAFVKAAETGIGIFEMDPGYADAECRQFTPIVEWITGEPARREAPSANVYQFGRPRDSVSGSRT
jgi:chromosome partitioning protein